MLLRFHVYCVSFTYEGYAGTTGRRKPPEMSLLTSTTRLFFTNDSAGLFVGYCCCCRSLEVVLLSVVSRSAVCQGCILNCADVLIRGIREVLVQHAERSCVPVVYLMSCRRRDQRTDVRKRDEYYIGLSQRLEAMQKCHFFLQHIIVCLGTFPHFYLIHLSTYRVLCASERGTYTFVMSFTGRGPRSSVTCLCVCQVHSVSSAVYAKF